MSDLLVSIILGAICVGMFGVVVVTAIRAWWGG
jgi:hypothetical protein